ncbi:solute carrier family 25 member 33 isoform X2 [Panthera leo]|uniref:solute carrier family 25 member 33 isoform X2 n=1 Tax=Panthera leo TaxID=9689 RepID=UPI001C6A26DC|nr:solute carrier family 25 member 33 isoform X2 [Panthera leo]
MALSSYYSHTITFILLKCTSGFSVVTEFCNHHHYLILELFHHSRRKHVPINSPSHRPTPLPWRPLICFISLGRSWRRRDQSHFLEAWVQIWSEWHHQAFVTNTLMNPIWMVKTRMQLERKVRGSKQMNTLQCARYVYQTEGVRGFYRGLTASYAGISETIICFAIYESLKKYLKEAPLASSTNGTEKNSTSFFGLMAAAAISKGCASCIAYPHEVIRTRLREEGTKYKSFIQTARLVFREEGYLAFYRGLFAQLIRQIPNTAIVLSTYELIVYLLEDRTQ